MGKPARSLFTPESTPLVPPSKLYCLNSIRMGFLVVANPVPPWISWSGRKDGSTRQRDDE